MKLSRLRVAFQVLLHAVLVGHVIAYYCFGWTKIGAIDFQAFFHYFLGEGLLTAGAIFALLMFGGALVFGRLFCSWGCHFGATQDLAAWVLRRLGWKPPLVRTRFLHWAPYLVLLAVFLLPLLDHWRGARWWPPRLDLAAVAPWDTLPGWFLSAVMFLACGAGVLLFLGTRGFCRFLCPYGAVFRLTDRAAPYQVRRVAACGAGCGPGGVHPCTAACPTAIDVHAETLAHGKVTSPDCVRCNLCIEACPAGALAHVTRRGAETRLAARPAPAVLLSGTAPVPGAEPGAPASFRPLAVPIHAAAAPPPPSSPPPRTYDLPLWGEVVIALVAVITYLAVDLVYGGHFLAAAIALGEGFLAFTVLRAVVGPAGGSVLGFPLRREGRWTFAAVTLAGALALSAIPIAQAGAFRWLGWQGARLDPLARAAPALPGAAPTAPLTAGERTRLESAAASYALALALFPAHIETRLLLLRAYLVLGDPRAVAEAEEIARRSPPGNALARDALRAAYEKFGPPGAPARRGE